MGRGVLTGWVHRCGGWEVFGTWVVQGSDSVDPEPHSSSRAHQQLRHLLLAQILQRLSFHLRHRVNKSENRSKQQQIFTPLRSDPPA